MNTNFIMVDVTNGEGYSEPRVVSYRNESVANCCIEVLREDYINAGYSWEVNNEPYNKKIMDLSYGDDNSAIYLFETKNRFAVIKIMPGECFAGVLLETDNLLHADSCLTQESASAKILDIDTRTDNVISGHTDDGFVWFGVVGTDSE